MTNGKKCIEANVCGGLRTPRRSEAGFSLLELLMVTGIIGVLSAIAIPLLTQAVVTAETKSMVSEGRTVHTAFKNYFMDHGEYPNSGGAGAFELDTFEPLRSNGYYRGTPGIRILDDKADAYGSPDDEGTNQEFWLEMTLKIDTSVRFLIADSDDAPLSGGETQDGIFAYENGVIKKM